MNKYWKGRNKLYLHITYLYKNLSKTLLIDFFELIAELNMGPEYNKINCPSAESLKMYVLKDITYGILKNKKDLEINIPKDVHEKKIINFINRHLKYLNKDILMYKTNHYYRDVNSPPT